MKITVAAFIFSIGCGSVSVDDNWDADADVEEDTGVDVEETADEADEVDAVSTDDVVEPDVEDDAAEPDDAGGTAETDVAPVCPDDRNCTGLACGPDPVCGLSCGSCGTMEFCAAGVCTCRNGDTRCTDDRTVAVCVDGSWVTYNCAEGCTGPYAYGRCCTRSGSSFCSACDGLC